MHLHIFLFAGLCLVLRLNAEARSVPYARTGFLAQGDKAVRMLQQRMAPDDDTDLSEETENASDESDDDITDEQMPNTNTQTSHNVEANSNGSAALTNQSQELPTFAVLLTTYNTEDRQPMYMMRLQWWLRETKLPLFVVDSAGRGFPQSLSEIRSFKQLKFNQSDVLGDNVGSTEGELLSMRRAWEVFHDDWSRFDYVVKVTGKYVLPDLQSEMKKVHRGNSFIIEQFTDHPESGYLSWVNTEYLGFNATRMGDLLEKLANNEGAMEGKLGQVLMTHQYPVQQLERMMIPEQYRTERGAGDVLKAVYLQRSDKAKDHAVPQALK